jgi:hypothetical protein
MKVEIIEVEEGFLYSVTREYLGAVLLHERSFIQEGTMSFNDILECAYAKRYPERILNTTF